MKKLILIVLVALAVPALAQAQDEVKPPTDSKEVARLACIKAVLPSLQEKIQDSTFGKSYAENLAIALNNICGKPSKE